MNDIAKYSLELKNKDEDYTRYHIVFTIQKVAAFVISTALFVVSVASVISSSHNPFIYFRF